MVAVPLPVYGATGSTPSGTTRFSFLGCILNSRFATESVRQVTWQHDSTLSMYGLRIVTNGTTSASTANVRINSADGNQTITIPAGVTGWFQDTTNTDDVAPGDTVGDRTVNGGGGALISSTVVILNDADTNTVAVLGSLPTAGSLVAASTLYLFPLVGNGIPGTTESIYQRRSTGSAVVKNSYVYINANTRSDATPFITRINGADGNMSVSIPASTTGIFQDTTNSDTLADGDDWCQGLRTGAGTGAISVLHTKCEVETTDGSSQIYVNSITTTSVAATQTKYWCIGGAGSNATGEAAFRVDPSMTIEYERMQAYVSANGLTGDCNVRFRNNFANGSMLIVIPTTGTGVFEDTTNTESRAAGDTVDIQASATAGGTSISFYGFSIRQKATIFPSGGHMNLGRWWGP